MLTTNIMVLNLENKGNFKVVMYGCNAKYNLSNLIILLTKNNSFE